MHQADQAAVTQSQPRRRRRPGLPGQRRAQAGPRHLPVPAEPGPAGWAVQPGGEHLLADSHPVRAPGQLGRVVLHPADDVVPRRALVQRGRLEDRAQPQHPQSAQARQVRADAGFGRLDRAAAGIGHGHLPSCLAAQSTKPGADAGANMLLC